MHLGFFSKKTVLLLIILTGFFFITACYKEQQVIYPAGGTGAQWYGASADICGNYAIVGSPHKNNYIRGAVYIYEKSGETWTGEQELLFGSDYGEFGSAVAINETFAIVGTPGYYNNGVKCGAAHIIRRIGNNWYFFQTIVSPFNKTNSLFGSSVDINGDYAFVGAPLADTAQGICRGRVAVLRFTGSYWHVYTTLNASDQEYGDWFGFSVKTDGSYTIIGAPNKNGNTGAAYIFSNSSWSQIKKLIPQGVSSGAHAGWSVSIKGNYAVIGAPLENNEQGNGAGAAYFFGPRDGKTWQQINHFVPPHSGIGAQRFGGSVDIIENFAAVGAPYSYSGSGLVHIYLMESGAWAYMEELAGSNISSNAYFGTAVSLYDVYGIFGACQNPDESGLDTGAAYIFERDQD